LEPNNKGVRLNSKDRKELSAANKKFKARVIERYGYEKYKLERKSHQYEINAYTHSGLYIRTKLCHVGMNELIDYMNDLVGKVWYA
jgi:bisphosphoglycerate-dependent phosphoglycerate mutase